MGGEGDVWGCFYKAELWAHEHMPTAHRDTGIPEGPGWSQARAPELWEALC